MSRVSSTKKLPLHVLQSLLKIIYAASERISGVLEAATDLSPPRRFYTAAVLMAVLGQRALNATFPLYSWAIPSTHMDIPNLAMVYAT